MATDFTQDTLLRFLQSRGGSVKNSDLLLHFRDFIRDHADRDRNRELFKKSTASDTSLSGRNSRDTSPAANGALPSLFPVDFPPGPESALPGERRALPGERRAAGPSPGNAGPTPAGSAEEPLQKRQLKEVTTPAPPVVTAGKPVLPAAGILLNNNNNNVTTNFNLKQRQVTSTPGLPIRPAAAQVVSQIPVKTPSPSEPPAPDQCTQVGQHRLGFGPPPGITPVVAAVRHHGETRQQVPAPEALRGRETCLQPEGGLHQGPPLHHVGLQPQDVPRRIRYRPSYKSAVSYDEDGEEEEEVQMRQGSAGGAWPPSISASSPQVPPSVVSSSSSSSSSERKIPKIYVQDSETMPPGGPGWTSQSGAGQRGHWAEPGLEPGSSPAESTRRSLPLEAERYVPSPDRATGMVPHRDVHAHPTGVQPKPGQGSNQSQEACMSSSHSSVFSPSSDAGISSSDWTPSGSPRGPGWNSSFEDPQARAGVTRGGSQIQEALQRAQGRKLESLTHHANSETKAPWHHSTGNLHDDQEPTARMSPFHHSSDHLHDDQYSTARMMPWHLSTGDLHDDQEEAESSEGSTSSPPVLRPRLARRLSSQLRSRMCRSLGTNLDQLLEEEARVGGGSEAARLNRLHLISSSLSLRYNLSSSSLSSCSTPPRCHSMADLDEAVEGRGGRRRSSPAFVASSPTAQHEGSSRQSLVPLEPREHAWLVKGRRAPGPTSTRCSERTRPCSTGKTSSLASLCCTGSQNTATTESSTPYGTEFRRLV
ncbi:uncharacterized protein LOC129102789 [Anoplopoma fimbria]|uniref:uncharacterized protein LOC129102789 n=1 Tax=Anoplopoma fimbria TaxID=229290 RepID=UPI0023EC9739|nr:uncharacterized protein LOC129102789 [Anoplopoma fimbria]